MSTASSAQAQQIDPPLLYPDYKSTIHRAPLKPFIIVPGTLTDLTGPVYGHEALRDGDNDLTCQHIGEPIGERIIVHGRVLDEEGRGVPETLLEIWQANASGRYVHLDDQHAAPLDPNFTGAGRALTNADGDYRFVTIKPGAYPWRNHRNAWRPAHIHFSLFGLTFTSRLVTQVYFPGDPLLRYDPILQAVPPQARERLVATFDPDNTLPGWALAYRFDIVVRGRAETPRDTD